MAIGGATKSKRAVLLCLSRAPSLESECITADYRKANDKEHRDERRQA